MIVCIERANDTQSSRNHEIHLPSSKEWLFCVFDAVCGLEWF